MISFFRKMLDKQALGAAAANACFWFLTLFYMEALLHEVLFDKINAMFWYTVGFSAVLALVISTLLGLLPEKANRIASICLVSALSILFCTQIVYHAVFGSMYSLALVSMGGQALTNFWRETLRTIQENISTLIAMLLPIVAAAVLTSKKKSWFALGLQPTRLVSIALAGAFLAVTLVSLRIGGTGFFSTYDFFYGANTTTDQAAERFGLLTTMSLELAGRGQEDSAEDDFVMPARPATTPAPTTPPVTTPPDTTTLPGQTPPVETTAPVVTQPPIRYNTLEIDFDYLNTLTKDEKLLQLNAYVEALAPTQQNEYTGILSGYNLITLCAESFSTGAIHPELTPTLYKLSTEGFIFNNYYNAYPNVTTDGEYSFCLGLWPDTSRSKSVSSFYATRSSYLPFALGNVFADQAGVSSYGYHNYLGSYYGREQTHPNMGYTCKFMNDGLKLSSSWPASDLEMMEQTVGDYISSDKQFHAYYMTFSGHYKYDRENPIVKRNYDLVKDLPYGEAAKCYLAGNYELEKALAYLMEELEKAGVADKTAIVLAGDHFPYGLEDREYSELMGYKIDDFSKYKSTLIFWVGGMDEPVYVDEYMCNVDILPTILNLWGFQYDSRLLAGTDIFSDGEHIAVLRDQSFLTDKVWFNASTGETRYLVDKAELPESYVEDHINMVKNQFSLSKNILNKAYYNFLFEKGNVVIDRYSWWNEVEDDN